MKGEEGIVCCRVYKGFAWQDEFKTHEKPDRYPDQEKGENGHKIKDSDAFMVR